MAAHCRGTSTGSRPVNLVRSASLVFGSGPVVFHFSLSFPSEWVVGVKNDCSSVGRADFAATVSPHRGLRRGLVGFSFFGCCGMLDKAGVTGSEHILACLSFFAPAGS